jgi:hypothetical protein
LAALLAFEKPHDRDRGTLIDIDRRPSISWQAAVRQFDPAALTPLVKWRDSQTPCSEVLSATIRQVTSTEYSS